jgi:hypothetical protein
MGADDGLGKMVPLCIATFFYQPAVYWRLEETEPYEYHLALCPRALSSRLARGRVRASWCVVLILGVWGASWRAA